MKVSKRQKSIRQTAKQMEAIKASLRRGAIYPGPGSKVTLITWSMTGEEFPRHLQVAYGRGVFRLLKSPGPGIKGGLTYLRDLPLALRDLDRRGYPYALIAYAAECSRIGQPMSL